MIFSRVTCKWHKKFVQKLACHMCVNVKLKLSCTVYVCSFKSHFSLPFDRYNNRLTVYAYTIYKGAVVYFY